MKAVNSDGSPEPFTRKPETQAVAEELENMTQGQSIELSVLSERLGFNVRAELGSCYKVREALRTSGKGVWTFSDGSITRLSCSGVVNYEAPRQRKRVANTVRRGLSALGTVKYEKLNDTERTKFNAHLSLFGALKLATSSPVRNRIEDESEARQRPLDLADTLKLFEK